MELLREILGFLAVEGAEEALLWLDGETLNVNGCIDTCLKYCFNTALSKHFLSEFCQITPNSVDPTTPRCHRKHIPFPPRQLPYHTHQGSHQEALGCYEGAYPTLISTRDWSMGICQAGAAVSTGRKLA
jgi:hypothetical protein